MYNLTLKGQGQNLTSGQVRARSLGDPSRSKQITKRTKQITKNARSAAISPRDEAPGPTWAVGPQMLISFKCLAPEIWIVKIRLLLQKSLAMPQSMVVCILFALWLTGRMVLGLTACDCDQSITTETYSLFGASECIQKEPVATRRVAGFLERGELVPISGYTCSGVVSVTTYYSDTLSYNYIAKPVQTYPLTLTVQDCRMAVERGMWLYRVGDHVTTVKTQIDAQNEFKASYTGKFPRATDGSCTYKTLHEMHAGVLRIEEITGISLPDTSQAYLSPTESTEVFREHPWGL